VLVWYIVPAFSDFLSGFNGRGNIPPPSMMIGFVFAPEIASTFVEDADPTFVGSFVASLVR